jgi:hypothetical protein
MIPPQPVSLFRAMSPASMWTHRVLFQPFNLSKWFAIGFGAFLAHLGEGGGTGGDYANRTGAGDTRTAAELLDQARTWVAENMTWLVPVSVLAFVLLAGLSVLLVWLSSRGRFIFLHQIVGNSPEIARPWREYGREANALCLLRLAAGLTAWALVAAVVAASWPALIHPLLQAREWRDAFLMPALATGLGLGVILVTHACFIWFVDAVAVPIQFRRRGGIVPALRAAAALAISRPGAMTAYVLSYALLAIAAFVVVLVVILLTCCTAGCLMAIPYIGTVVTLPLLVFLRSLQLIVLAQFGQEFDVWAECAERPTPRP